MRVPNQDYKLFFLPVKELFGTHEENSFTLDESRKDDISQVTQIELK